MRTFLAGFCAPGGPLAKAVGIFLEKVTAPPWGPGIFLEKTTPPWEFQKVTSLKILSLVMRTFLAGFCAPGGPLAKAVGDFPGKTAPPWGPRPPLGNFKKLSL